jgi:hypothetical protein
MDFESKLFLLKSAGLEDELGQMAPEYEAEASMLGSALLGGGALGLGGAAGYALGGKLPLSGRAGQFARLMGAAAVPAAALGFGEWVTRDNRGMETMNRDLQDIQSDIGTGLNMQQMDPMQLQQLAGRSDEIAQFLASQGV